MVVIQKSEVPHQHMQMRVYDTEDGFYWFFIFHKEKNLAWYICPANKAFKTNDGMWTALHRDSTLFQRWDDQKACTIWSELLRHPETVAALAVL